MNTKNIASVIYMCAPVNALIEGIYEESIPMSEIARHGDFGLGTFNHLDGEMIMLDGQVYQAASDGTVKRITEDVMTPFSCVTFFNPISHDDISSSMEYAAMMSWLKELLYSPNLFYAIRMDGLFNYIKVRSVPRQEHYRPLVEVAREQTVFEYENVEGTLAGFFTPSFMGAVSVAGFHLHFLSSDRTCGGHLMECSPAQVKVGVQPLSTLELSLPTGLDYLTCSFGRDTEGELKQVE